MDILGDSQSFVYREIEQLENAGVAMVPEPSVFVKILEGSEIGPKLVRMAAGFSACLSIAGGCLMSASGLVAYSLADRLDRNTLLGAYDMPMKDEEAAWTCLSVAFILIAFDEFVSILFVAIASQRVCHAVRSVALGWPERHWVYLPRYMMCMVGSVGIFASALRIVSLVRRSGYVAWMTRDVGMPGNMSIDVVGEASHAMARMLVGCALRTATLITQLAADGFNVCYIVPVSRECVCCGSAELSPALWTLSPTRTGLADQHLSRRVNVRRLYTSVSWGADCTAKLVHNWWGAVRMHTHVSDVCLFAGLYLRYQLMTADHAPSYRPHKDSIVAAMYNSSYTELNSLYNSDSGFAVGKEDTNDTAMLITSAFLVFVAGILSTSSAIAKAVGISRCEASIPSNHHHTSRIGTILCP